MRALIIGGGIGGLTAALSLERAGIEVAVFEAVTELKPLGLGINLLPHAVRELCELGLEEALTRVAIQTERLIYHTKYGRPIWNEPRGRFAGYKWPQFSIHRGDLQMVLKGAVEARLGTGVIRTGYHCTGFEQDSRGVSAHFVDRASGRALADERGDVLIAADGIHSTIRGLLYPNEGPAKFAGVMMWRGAVERQPFLGGQTMAVCGHWYAKTVTYPISKPADDRGRSLVNWVAEIRTGEPTVRRKEDWNRKGALADFLPTFESWKFDWLDLPALFRATEMIYEFPMVDRDPLPSWTRGRVTLLGDAAHPMYPIGSNGASQGVLDGRSIAHALASHPDIAAALNAYEADRLPATAAVVLSNREFGPERVLQVVEERCPPDCTDIAAYVPSSEMEEIAERYKRLAGFEKETLNLRSSYDVTARA
jgi:2-polyprenyl-6-methoxyphenol hydroxylase-like FAD-dependent oxidoreductase